MNRKRLKAIENASSSLVQVQFTPLFSGHGICHTVFFGYPSELSQARSGVKGKKDMTYVTWFILLVVSSVVGALTGLVLGGLVGNLFLALVAGILGTISAGVVHNIRIPQLMVIYSAVTVEIPLRVISYSLIASLVGSAAAVQIASMSGITSSAAIGALAGLIAGILTAILTTVYVPHKSKSNQQRG